MGKEKLLSNRVISFISKQLNIKASQLSEETYFATDLGVVSFQVMELICEIEEHFSCEIPDEDIRDIRQVKDLVTIIQNYHASNTSNKEIN